ncbi:MAG: hypothetical protein ACRD26_02170, partial [Vicinamibacterales bacterium]
MRNDLTAGASPPLCAGAWDGRRIDAGQPPRLEADHVALLSGVRTGPERRAALRFAIEQRFFGLGFGRAGAARAWYRRYEWIRTRRQLGAGGAARALVKRPGRIAREAWRAVRLHGAAVRELHGTPL